MSVTQYGQSRTRVLESAASEGGGAGGGSSGTATAPEDQPSFDYILRELQSVVERLESEELTLEQSLQAFERGIALSRRGQEILDAAERKVELLLRNGTTEAFNPAGRS